MTDRNWRSTNRCNLKYFCLQFQNPRNQAILTYTAIKSYHTRISSDWVVRDKETCKLKAFRQDKDCRDWKGEGREKLNAKTNRNCFLTFVPLASTPSSPHPSPLPPPTPKSKQDMALLICSLQCKPENREYQTVFYSFVCMWHELKVMKDKTHRRSSIFLLSLLLCSSFWHISNMNSWYALREKWMVIVVKGIIVYDSRREGIKIEGNGRK